MIAGETAGVVVCGTVATLPMVICTTANMIAAFKGRKKPARPKSNEKDFSDSPSTRVGPDKVKCFLDGSPVRIHDLGFDGEVLLCAPREGDYQPTIALSGASVVQKGATIKVEHSLARSMELKFSNETLAKQWFDELSPCAAYAKPYARIDELRKCVMQQQMQIKSCRDKIYKYQAASEHAVDYKEKCGMLQTQLEKLKTEVVTEEKLLKQREEVQNLAAILHDRFALLDREIPAKQRSLLQSMQEDLHSRIARVEQGGTASASSSNEAENQRLRGELQLALAQKQEALAQKQEIEGFAQQLERRIQELQSKFVMEGVNAGGYNARGLQVAPDANAELSGRLQEAESKRLQLQAAVAELEARLGVAESAAPSGGQGSVSEQQYMQLQQTLQAFEAEANQTIQQQDMTIQALMGEKDTYQAESKRLGAEYETLQREAYREKQARQELEASLGQSQSPVQDPQVPLLKQDLELVQAKVADVENERNQALSQVSTLQRELQDFRLQCQEQTRQFESQARQEYDATLLGLQQEKRAIDQKASDLEASKDMMARDFQEMNLKLRMLEEEKRVIEQRALDFEVGKETMAKEFEAELIAIQQRHNEEMQRVQGVQADRDAHFSRIQSLEQEKAALLSEVEMVSAKHRQLEQSSAGRTSETSAQIFELQQRVMDAEVRAAGFEAKLTAAEQSKVNATEQLSQMEQVLGMEKQKRQELESQTRSRSLETHELQVTELAQAVQSKDRMLDQLQENARVKDQMLQQMQDERSIMENERNTIVSENTNLRAAYDELKMAYETSIQTVQSSPPMSPPLGDQNDQALISKLTEQNSDLKNQLELTWKKINEQTKRIEEERTAFWEELEQVRLKTGVKPAQATIPSSISKPPTFSTGPPTRKAAEMFPRTSSTESSASGRIGVSKYSVGTSFGSRSTGAPLRAAGTPEGGQSRLLLPGSGSSYGSPSARPVGMTYAQTAAVSGRPISGETVRALNASTRFT